MKTLGLLVLSLLLSLPSQAAEEKDEELPIEFSADRVYHDKNGAQITAVGHVEAYYDESIIRAGEVTYNIEQDVLAATGDVVILYKDGSTAFVDKMEIRDRMKRGILSKLHVIRPDKSNITAESATQRPDGSMLFRKASYTPCDLCEGKEPSWQLRAEEIVHDKEDGSYVYRNAKFDVVGVPVFYTPYLSHSDPRKKGNTGFLVPKFGSSNKLGQSIALPFFWDVSEQHKVTLTPTFISEDNPMITGDYAGFAGATKLDFFGHYTHTEEDKDLFYVKANTQSHINEVWRTKIQYERTSDHTFLRLYDPPAMNPPWLTSYARAEAFQSNSHLSITAYDFQNMRATLTDDDVPWILPEINYDYVSDPTSVGAYWRVNANALYLENPKAEEMRRLSTSASFNMPWVSGYGEIYEAQALVRADYYSYSNLPDEYEHNNVARIHPALSLSWRYPFARTDSVSTQTIEPVASVSFSPSQTKNGDIVNEDSQDVEFDETSVLLNNRFNGYDRIEGGSHINYGLKFGAYTHDNRQVTAFFGQSWRLLGDSKFSENSGLYNRLSDYVAKVRVVWGQTLTGDYHVRFREDNFKIQRQEFNLFTGPKLLRFGMQYLFLVRDQQGAGTYLPQREEINLSLSSHLTRYWSAFATTLYDMQKNKSIQNNFGIVYEDECFNFSFLIRKDFTENRDYNTGLSFMFKIDLKTLGAIKTSNMSF